MERASNPAFSPPTWKHLRKIKTADILVGITSYNNAHTINYVVYQAAKGLETYFSNLRSAIFVSDGNSTDGTLATIEALRLPFKVDVIPATYNGVSGKGSAVKAIFEAARFLNVRAVALVDSDLRSITPYWIHLLISPTLTGTGFVTPFYVRHKYDGTITNFLCFPVTSSLYGREIRQPIGGDFGLSIELVEELLESPLWQTQYVPRFGIDIFETHTALAKRMEVKQAFLGTKVHEAKDPGTHLDSMFRQVVGSMFTCIEYYDQVWKKIRGHRKLALNTTTKSGRKSAATVEWKSSVKKHVQAHQNQFK
jgi:glycosyltransferase involved in cell wall biosynthesis